MVVPKYSCFINCNKIFFIKSTTDWCKLTFTYILVCVAIYAVLIQGIATGGDPIGAIWGIVGYTVLLCFMLFKTGSIARSIFNAH